MCSGLSGDFSIFLRSLTMKLSTVRFDGPASTPQIFWRISSRETGWPDALDEEPEELDLVERELLDLARRRSWCARSRLTLRLADGEHLGALGRARRRGGRWRGAARSARPR